MKKPIEYVDAFLGLAGLARRRRAAFFLDVVIPAATLVAVNVGYLNHQFATEVPAPIDYGIGIHAGEVIIGDVGFRGRTVFTALGDSVNVAARLQDMTKALNCKLVVSEEVCKAAAVSGNGLTAADINIRGHDAPIGVRTVEDPTVLVSMLETGHSSLIESQVAGHG